MVLVFDVYVASSLSFSFQLRRNCKSTDYSFCFFPFFVLLRSLFRFLSVLLNSLLLHRIGRGPRLEGAISSSTLQAASICTLEHTTKIRPNS